MLEMQKTWRKETWLFCFVVSFVRKSGSWSDGINCNNRFFRLLATGNKNKARNKWFRLYVYAISLLSSMRTENSSVFDCGRPFSCAFLRQPRLKRDMGSSLFSQKMWESRLKVKRNSYFPENPFENCQLPADVLLSLAFFRSELKCQMWEIKYVCRVCMHGIMTRTTFTTWSRPIKIDYRICNALRYTACVFHAEISAWNKVNSVCRQANWISRSHEKTRML